MSTSSAAESHADNAARLAAEVTASSTRLAQLEAEYQVLLADPGTNQEDRDTVRQLVEEARQVFQSAEAALDRISSGTYGRCERCGGQIDAERLAALPDTTTCITCQSR